MKQKSKGSIEEIYNTGQEKKSCRIIILSWVLFSFAAKAALLKHSAAFNRAAQLYSKKNSH